jgi:GH25 family lysozyme M1 (1,4-beta-N-acetylmuramidase)
MGIASLGTHDAYATPALSVTSPIVSPSGTISKISVEPKSGTVYLFEPVISATRVVSICGGSKKNNARVEIRTSAPATYQRFKLIYDAKRKYWYIRNVKSNRNIDLRHNKTSNGTPLLQYKAKAGSAGQGWVLRPSSRFKDAFEIATTLRKSQVWHIASGQNKNGKRLVLDKDNNAKAEAFYLIPYNAKAITSTCADVSDANGLQIAAGSLADTRTYEISSNYVAKNVEVPGASTADNTPIEIYKDSTSLRQYWRFYAADSGFYYIRNVNSGKALDVRANNQVEGSKVVQYRYDGGNSQKWAIVKGGNATKTTYQLVSAISGLAMGVSGASKSNSARMCLYPTSYGRTVFKLQATQDLFMSDNIYTFKDLGSQKVLQMNTADRTLDQAATIAGSISSNAQKFLVHRVVDAGAQSQYALESTLSGGFLQDTVQTVGAMGDLGQLAMTEVPTDSELTSPAYMYCRWQVVYCTHGFTLRNVGSGRYVYINGSDVRTSINKHSNFSESASGSYLNGVDVSRYQPADIASRINYDFMIVKAGQRGRTGSSVYDNYKAGGVYNQVFKSQAKSVLAHGKMLGMYYYADNLTKATTQAKFFYDIVKNAGLLGKGILVLDYEDGSLLAKSTASERDWIKSFCNEVYKLSKQRCIVYTSQSHAAILDLPNLCQSLGTFFWCARYRTSATIKGYDQGFNSGISCTMYQYTSKGKLPGFNDYLDLNVFYGTRADWKKWL